MDPLSTPPAPNVDIISPSEGSSVLGGSMTFEWMRSGTFQDGDHVHVMLDGPGPYVAVYGTDNRNHTFDGIGAGTHTLTVSIVNALHTSNFCSQQPIYHPLTGTTTTGCDVLRSMLMGVYLLVMH